MATRFGTGFGREYYVTFELDSTSANDGNVGFIPMIGYHHVLMILIAVIIILLCESFRHLDHMARS
jgi:hypothetical protein